MSSSLNMSRRIRRTPFTDRVEEAGVSGFSVVNHMLLPKRYQHSPEEDYWHLRERVQIWDVSCQRQVEINGKDATRLIQSMTPRNLAQAKTGQCLYVPITDHNGGMINDPVLLKQAEDRYWLSIADSDVLLWAMGLAEGASLDVKVCEPDVSPLAIQGPRAEDLLAHLFGEHIRKIGFFRFGWIDFAGTRQLIARSGYSRQGGFEIYLNDSGLGSRLWDDISEAGKAFDIRPGYPNLAERIEGGLLSLGNEFTRENNPFECGLGKFCDLDGGFDFIGKQALQHICQSGHAREIRGIRFDRAPCPPCGKPWPVTSARDGARIGMITSAAASPRLQTNIGLSMIERDYWTPGEAVHVHVADGTVRDGVICNLPFI